MGFHSRRVFMRSLIVAVRSSTLRNKSRALRENSPNALEGVASSQLPQIARQSRRYRLLVDDSVDDEETYRPTGPIA